MRQQVTEIKKKTGVPLTPSLCTVDKRNAPYHKAMYNRIPPKSKPE